MNKKYYLLLIMLICMLCPGCSKEPSPISKTGFFFDTYITITLYDESQQPYLDHCIELCEYYQNLFDKNTTTSDVYRINHANGTLISVEQDTFDIIEKAILYGQESNGIFDITIGSLSELWDITNKTIIPEHSAIQTVLDSVGYQTIQLNQQETTIQLHSSNTKIDLGGIAKGYIADKLKEYLVSEGVEHGLINLGGNILLINDKPNHANYQIGIQKPFGKMGETCVSVSAVNKSIVTSGVYQRYFYENDKLYHHILDATTGYPVETDLLGVTIISDTSVAGDCYSTMCLAFGLEYGMEFLEKKEDAEGIFITKDNVIHLTSGLIISDNIITIK